MSPLVTSPPSKGKVEEAEKATADQRTKLEEITKDSGVAKLEVGVL